MADVKARLSAYLDAAEEQGPVVITRNGKPVAVLVAPLDDEDLERLIMAHSPRFRALLTRSRASLRTGRGVNADAFWSDVAGTGHRKTADTEDLKRNEHSAQARAYV
jgi:prevent-host-death family protein